MKLRARWRTSGVLLLLLGSCNTFDDPGDSAVPVAPPNGVFVPPIPPSFPIPGVGPISSGMPVPASIVPIGPAGSGGMPFAGGQGGAPVPQAGMQPGMPAAGISGGWQPVSDAGASDDDAGL